MKKQFLMSKMISGCCLQAEFQRLALGFKCDMFTLEKRLRLEERSRDLAEENVRREVSSCQGLLQASRLEVNSRPNLHSAVLRLGSLSVFRSSGPDSSV